MFTKMLRQLMLVIRKLVIRFNNDYYTLRRKLRRSGGGWTIYASLAEVDDGPRNEANAYPFNWIKEIEEHYFDGFFEENDEEEFDMGKMMFKSIKSDISLNQMSEVCFFFSAPNVILNDNYLLMFQDVSPLVLETLMKEFVPHYKNVKQMFIQGECKEIHLEEMKEESKELIKNLISTGFYPVISDLYRGKDSEKSSGPRKLKYFLINKESIPPLYLKETKKIQEFIQNAFFDKKKPFLIQPVGWKLEQNLQDSITIRSFSTFAKQIVLLVNTVDDSVEGMYIFG
ncbi:hypothetical protein E2K98_12840 [Bacillus salipaludis]|uniref:Uncharacterized protein n=1 Tax=Bacillus salipaludis TaxID=2547811 RepID=A0A4R5VTI3_9BACI|nr:hypothetical protein [Bacillus salipaludis]TDK61770.1 hypothetical protein E2K98_12840 [Bacillus salipaludis]